MPVQQEALPQGPSAEAHTLIRETNGDVERVEGISRAPDHVLKQREERLKQESDKWAKAYAKLRLMR